ncbi:hypothetical protein HMPREF0653_02099 [Prevotella disiens JCM 6334 = ATCC 29426]|uniref:Uncharacterized protein n=1 Tax=Prevotella disiens JCM 6334 = ATCC 29426 TaxID=1235811 RepID=A0ABN0NQ84_9BACT|nr:hypothetical protein HMPREF0653_02099 [Prevotella disiens JCM 6334 = ATCC 29426]
MKEPVLIFKTGSFDVQNRLFCCSKQSVSFFKAIFYQCISPPTPHLFRTFYD